jgi:hypothetical protein
LHGAEPSSRKPARKLRLRLGGDPTDDEYPDKPPRMRWAIYNRLLDKLRAADGVADERLRRVLINAQMSGFVDYNSINALLRYRLNLRNNAPTR